MVFYCKFQIASSTCVPSGQAQPGLDCALRDTSVTSHLLSREHEQSRAFPAFAIFLMKLATRPDALLQR
jgi:hypothetical protein